MAQFESTVKMVPAPVETIFNTLSDLNNLEKIKDKIPADKVKDFSFDADSCSFSVTGRKLESRCHRTGTVQNHKIRYRKFARSIFHVDTVIACYGQ